MDAEMCRISVIVCKASCCRSQLIMPPQQKKRKASVEVFSASEDEEEEIPPMKARPTKRGYSTRLSAQNSQTPRKSKRRCGASESRPEAPGSSRIITPPCRLVTEQPVVKRKASARMNNESSVDRTNVATTSSNGQGKAQLKRLDGEAEKGACALCDRFDSDRNIYFRMDNQDDLTAHYLCMFTASNLCQVEDPRLKKPGTVWLIGCILTGAWTTIAFREAAWAAIW